MSTNTPITLKIYHGDDIRRLHLETLNWKELTQLISSTYPSPYTLKYRDTENDLVTMVAQQDLQDAYDMSQGDVLHLHVIPNIESASASTSTSTSTSTSGPDIDMKSTHDDLASELSSEEISTLLSECLSDPSIITVIPSFLSTFIDQLSHNITHSNPLSTAWTQTLQQHTIIRDHVILSVLLPRMQQAITRADSNNVASRIPIHVFPMIKGLLPMLPAFLPTLVPMFTQLMSNPNNPNNPSSTTTTDTQQQATNNPFATNNPLMNLLGPMLSGMQPQAPSSSSTASTSSPSAAPFNPLSLLGPLLAGAAANANPAAASPSSSSSTNASSQAQANPLLGLLGPLLAANANNNNTANNPLASLMQQFAAQAHDNSSTSSTTTTNYNNNNNNSTADYTEQLAILESMQVGTPEMNLSLLQQCNGSVERVVQLLAME